MDRSNNQNYQHTLAAVPIFQPTYAENFNTGSGPDLNLALEARFIFEVVHPDTVPVGPPVTNYCKILLLKMTVQNLHLTNDAFTYQRSQIFNSLLTGKCFQKGSLKN